MWYWVIFCCQVGQVEVMSQLLHCQTTHLLLEGVVLIIQAAGVLKTLVTQVFRWLDDAFHLGVQTFFSLPPNTYKHFPHYFPPTHSYWLRVMHSVKLSPKFHQSLSSYTINLLYSYLNLYALSFRTCSFCCCKCLISDDTKFERIFLSSHDPKNWLKKYLQKIYQKSGSICYSKAIFFNNKYFFFSDIIFVNTFQINSSEWKSCHTSHNQNKMSYLHPK